MASSVMLLFSAWVTAATKAVRKSAKVPNFSPSLPSFVIQRFLVALFQARATVGEVLFSS